MNNTGKIDDLPRSQITPCVMCGQSLMHDGALSFYRVRLDFLLVDVGAIERARIKMEQIKPGSALAICHDERFAVGAWRDEGLVCLSCARRYPLVDILDACQHTEEVSCARS